MKAFVTTSLALVLSGMVCHASDKVEIVQKAVEEFHKLFNAGEFGKIYDATHAKYQSLYSKEDAVDFMRSSREKLGNVTSAKLTGQQEFDLKPVTNVILTYTTEFEKGQGQEMFTYQVEGKKALLTGWSLIPAK